MGDPHNPERAGELWDAGRIDYMEQEIAQLNSFVPVVVSGGWAWHYMSPAGHAEIKTHHDHKDIDIFVDPKDFHRLVEYFEAYRYRRAKTLYDDPSGQFYRYVKHYELGKVVFDVFLDSVVPSISVNEIFLKGAGVLVSIRVVEPQYLLSLYGVKHTSEECLAVIAAKKLVAQGISPVSRNELVDR